MFSILISCVFPIIGSFNAHQQLQAARTALEKSNLNIAGISVPLNVFLKSASENTSELTEAQLVVYRSNQVEKWLVYWIVLLSAYIVSQVLLLSYWVPFYGVIKLLASLWLVAPFVLPSGEPSAAARDMATFYSVGCGYCYSQLLGPWLNARLKAFSEMSGDSSAYETALKVVRSGLGYARVPTWLVSSEQAPAADYRSAVVSQLSAWGLFTVQQPAEPTDQEEEEFDIIDSPDTATSSAAEAHTSKASKKGWFW